MKTVRDRLSDITKFHIGDVETAYFKECSYGHEREYWIGSRYSRCPQCNYDCDIIMEPIPRMVVLDGTICVLYEEAI